MALKMIFEIFELIKSLKFKKIGRFWRKQGPFTQNFAKVYITFFVPKVLRTIFYPYKHLSQGQKLKTGQKMHFFGTPCRYPEIGKFKNNIRIKNRATGQQLHWVNLCKHVLKGLIFVVKSMVRIANECSSIYRNYCLSVWPT